jgi:hypothetical protein
MRLGLFLFHLPISLLLRGVRAIEETETAIAQRDDACSAVMIKNGT